MTPQRMMKRKFWMKRTAGPVAAIHPFTKRPITVNPQRDALITRDLDAELRKLPALLSWYMACRSQAKTALNEARHEEHNISEDLYAEIREQKGAKKVTETELKMAVKTDPRMRAAFRKRMDAEEMVRNMEDAVEQIATKKWTLRDLVQHQLLERGTKDHL